MNRTVVALTLFSVSVGRGAYADESLRGVLDVEHDNIDALQMLQHYSFALGRNIIDVDSESSLGDVAVEQPFEDSVSIGGDEVSIPNERADSDGSDFEVSETEAALGHASGSLSSEQNTTAVGRKVSRVLFIGNSFTYVNNLPAQLKLVAKSLGHDVQVASSTTGGCTLYRQTLNKKTQDLLKKDWDFIVLQDFSMLPTVKTARATYLKPAIERVVKHKRQAKIVMYMTWGYQNGYQNGACPPTFNQHCFPLGSLASLTSPSCHESDSYSSRVKTFDCMAYSLARGYLETKKIRGVDLVAPCGLAWQAARGSKRIPRRCKSEVDAEYDTTQNLTLPIQIKGSALPTREFNVVYSTDNINKHPDRAGQYLNALTMYATLFGKSPVGAAGPKHKEDRGISEKALSTTELQALQNIAIGVVNQCGAACGTR